jgi:hypothetical protein
MYKGASKFRQALARKGRKLTSRNLVTSDSAPKRKPIRTRLQQRLDREVKNAARAAETGIQTKPALVKRRAPTDPTN